MSKRARKTLEALLEGAERLKRNDAIALLEYLGFKHRVTGSHHIWTHPKAAARVTWNERKKTADIQSYLLVQLRDAVNTVLDTTIQSKEPEEMATPLKQLQSPLEQINLEVLPNSITLADVTIAESIILISSSNMPDEVAELIYSYEKKEINGNELCKLLNDSSYRTATGKEFTPNNAYGTLVNNKLYYHWKRRQHDKEREEMGIQYPARPVPSLPPEPPVIEKKTAPFVLNPETKPPAFDPQQVLYSLNSIFEENQKLKLENERLTQIVESIKKVVCDNG